MHTFVTLTKTISQASNLKHDHSFVYTLLFGLPSSYCFWKGHWVSSVKHFGLTLWPVFSCIACKHKAQITNNKDCVCFISSTLIILTPETIRKKKKWIRKKLLLTYIKYFWIFNEHDNKAENKLAFFSHSPVIIWNPFSHALEMLERHLYIFSHCSTCLR